jgi:hypothetical protein
MEKHTLRSSCLKTTPGRNGEAIRTEIEARAQQSNFSHKIAKHPN